MGVIVFIVSIFIGSFLSLCIYRIPLNESVIGGRSHCPKCGHCLEPLDLVPLISFIMLKGSCRYCKKPISIRYPVIEILTPVTTITIYTIYGLTWEFFFYALWAAILLVASAIDLRQRVIPNRLIILGMVLGALFPLVNPHLNYYDSFLGLATGFGIMLIISQLARFIIGRQAIGGGDIKFLGLIGMFLGWKLAILSFILSIYIGGITSLLLILLKLKHWGDYIPFGPFLAFGALVSLLWGTNIIGWYGLLIY